ncbi:MAG: hypothetical protein HQM16_08645 [Deltaproteobacteria bacterium]|nr:hypothetical protein [Deltaproteobacteria bacterium]
MQTPRITMGSVPLTQLTPAGAQPAASLSPTASAAPQAHQADQWTRVHHGTQPARPAVTKIAPPLYSPEMSEAFDGQFLSRDCAAEVAVPPPCSAVHEAPVVNESPVVDESPLEIKHPLVTNVQITHESTSNTQIRVFGGRQGALLCGIDLCEEKTNEGINLKVYIAVEKKDSLFTKSGIDAAVMAAILRLSLVHGYSSLSISAEDDCVTEYTNTHYRFNLGSIVNGTKFCGGTYRLNGSTAQKEAADLRTTVWRHCMVWWHRTRGGAAFRASSRGQIYIERLSRLGIDLGDAATPPARLGSRVYLYPSEFTKLFGRLSLVWEGRVTAEQVERVGRHAAKKASLYEKEVQRRLTPHASASGHNMPVLPGLSDRSALPDRFKEIIVPRISVKSPLSLLKAAHGITFFLNHDDHVPVTAHDYIELARSFFVSGSFLEAALVFDELFLRLRGTTDSGMSPIDLDGIRHYFHVAGDLWLESEDKNPEGDYFNDLSSQKARIFFYVYTGQVLRPSRLMDAFMTPGEGFVFPHFALRKKDNGSFVVDVTASYHTEYQGDVVVTIERDPATRDTLCKVHPFTLLYRGKAIPDETQGRLDAALAGVVGEFSKNNVTAAVHNTSARITPMTTRIPSDKLTEAVASIVASWLVKRATEGLETEEGMIAVPLEPQNFFIIRDESGAEKIRFIGRGEARSVSLEQLIRDLLLTFVSTQAEEQRTPEQWEDIVAKGVGKGFVHYLRDEIILAAIPGDKRQERLEVMMFETDRLSRLGPVFSGSAEKIRQMTHRYLTQSAVREKAEMMGPQ